jgi:hypothetical protein
MTDLGRKPVGGGVLVGAGFLAAFLTFAAFPAAATLGDCGQPKSSGAGPSAADALEVLRTAVGLSSCGTFDDCTCDVDASGTVVAGDALRVLKKAVGQPQVLTCSCNVTTTTTTTTSSSTLPPVHSTELIVLTKSQGSYAIADMQGTWDASALETGPSAPEWIRGALEFQSNGGFSGSLTSSHGNTDNIAGKLAMASGGVLTCTQNCPADFRGALDSGKSVTVATDTLDDSSSELYVLTLRGASYAQADLAGTWNLASMISGGASPNWARGYAAVQSGGAFNAVAKDADGMTAHWSGTLSLSGVGRVTCSSPGCQTSFRGSLDSGKTVVVATQTRSDGPAELLLLVKRAASYSQADLTGSWQFQSLLSGADEPLWRRGSVAVAANGTTSGVINDSNGGSENLTGTMTIDSDGLARVSGATSLVCALDAGKTVLACTVTR